MKTDLEIYNYLNIVNRRVGKVYKLTGICPLPKNFVADEEKLKKILFLKQMENNSIFPEFIFNDKKSIKKYFKISLNYCKKLKKNLKIKSFMSQSFYEEFVNYLSIRIILTRLIIKDFRGQEIDETKAYQEIYNLNPIFGELLNEIYQPNFDIEATVSALEENYMRSYTQKLEAINKKERKQRKQKQAVEIQPKIQKTQQKQVENTKKTEKKVEKVQKQPLVAEKQKSNKQTKREK